MVYRILALDYARNLQKGYKKVFMDQRDIDEEMAKYNGSGRFSTSNFHVCEKLPQGEESVLDT